MATRYFNALKIEYAVTAQEVRCPVAAFSPSLGVSARDNSCALNLSIRLLMWGCKFLRVLAISDIAVSDSDVLSPTAHLASEDSDISDSLQIRSA